MVVLVGSDKNCSSSCQQPASMMMPLQNSLPMTADSSLSSSSAASSDDDLEGGYSSQEDAADNRRDVILSKFIPMKSGVCPRRRSQCEQLSFRQRTELLSLSSAPSTKSNGRTASVSLTNSQLAPAGGFRRWGAAVLSSANGNDLPKSIQFCPPADPYYQCSPYSNSKSKSSRDSNRLQRQQLLLLLFITVVLASGGIITSVLQRAELHALKKELSITNQHRFYMEKTQSNLSQEVATRNAQLIQYRSAHDRLKRVNKDASETIQVLKRELVESQNEIERLQAVERRGEWSEKRLNNFVQGVKERSYRSVVEKYGEGPHQVELEVQLPSSPDITRTVKIDLAPLDLMPHSVHTFLEQVSSGAWDGSAFDLHASHVLVAHASSSVLKEENASPASVVFPEYSPDYPHDKYTVAFSGRNGDVPNFYVNLQPNDSYHRPRVEASVDGSSSEELVEGEPCLGSIADVESRRVMDELDELKVGEGGRLGNGGVVIRSARIVERR